jgi:branched-chain amino acid transport system substrate-binding protein
VVAGLLLAAGALSGCANVYVTTATHAGDTDGITPTTITVGAMGSFSGFAASDFAPVVTGARVYFDQLDADGGVDGRRIVYGPIVDDGTSPSGDTAAAQRLVQAKVFAVVGVGTPFFTGSDLLRAQSVPTFGIQEDTDAQWAGPTLFGVGGSFVDETAPMPQVAYAVRRTRSRRAAVLAYNVAQSSGGCVAVIEGLARAHVPTPVVDLSIPYGAPSLDADVTRMQRAGVDFVATCMDAAGDIKLSQTLQQHGMGATVQYWLDGYDQATLDQNAAAMDGAYFLLQQTPFEVSRTAPGVYRGTDAFLAALRRYAPGTLPSTPALAGWVSADLFVQGLRAAGHEPTRSAVVAAINRLTAYTADGAMPPVDWRVAHTGVSPIDCTTFVRAVGRRFVPVWGGPRSVYVCFDQEAPPSTSVTTLPLARGVPSR